MIGRFRRNALSAWLCIVALALAPLTPAGLALGAPSAGEESVLCTAHGTTTVNPDQSGAPQPDGAAGHAHCAICLCVPTIGIAPAPGEVSLPLAPAQIEFRIHDRAGPAGPIDGLTQPRAPPLA